MEPRRAIERIDALVLATTGERNAYARRCGALALGELFTPDLVQLSAERCACGFRDRPDTQRFMRHLAQSSQALADKVVAGDFQPRYYREREIWERGKPRDIRPPTFESKVVQKLLNDWVVRPLIEPRCVSTCYSSITGRGCARMHADVERELNRRDGTGRAVLMTDFADYFASIDVDKLFERLGRLITGERVLGLMRAFSPQPLGLSLGNELSQTPASWYPSPIDHWAKDRMRLPYYRYMDDTLTVCENADEAAEIAHEYQSMAAALGLSLPDRKVRIVDYGQPFQWCKERYRFNARTGRYYRLINPEIPARERRKMHAMARRVEAGEMDARAAELQWRSVRGVISGHLNTAGVIARLDAEWASLFG